jgi:5-methylcytosine-specific restriction endonuclease McrA
MLLTEKFHLSRTPISYRAQMRLILWMKNPTCFVCRKIIRDYKQCTLEHVIPKSCGGKDLRNNLSISNKRCNQLKGSLLHRDESEKKLAETGLAFQPNVRLDL